MTNFTLATDPGSLPSRRWRPRRRILHIDPSVHPQRRWAMECAVKWMYSVDGALAVAGHPRQPHGDGGVPRRGGTDIWRRMDFIKEGNNAAHTGKDAREQAGSAWKTSTSFSGLCGLLLRRGLHRGQLTGAACAARGIEPPAVQAPDMDLEALIAENAALKAS